MKEGWGGSVGSPTGQPVEKGAPDTWVDQTPWHDLRH